MNNDKHTKSATEADPQIDQLIWAALADSTLPPLPDVDASAAAEALTQADWAKLDSLGSSRDLVRRVIASVSSQERPISNEATCSANLDETISQPGPFKDNSLDLDALLTRLREVEEAKQIPWPSCYLKREELGRGGQGTVYRYLDELFGEQALKFFSPKPYGSASAYREHMRRILDVASVVHRLNLDNVVQVQRFVDYRGIFVMVMQRIDGFDLRRLLDVELRDNLRQHVDPKRRAFLDDVIYAMPAPGRLCLQPFVAVNIVEKCLRGLSGLHEHGLIHGDVKPSNIMLDSNGSIRLIDIGSACALDAPPRQRIWTPRYAPLEFLERGEWTPQSDLASLGYVLIELLCGQAEVFGLDDRSTTTSARRRDTALLKEKRKLLDRLPNLLPENLRRTDDLIQLCRRLIHTDPNSRFEDANQAIVEGTWFVRRRLIASDLAIHDATEIKRWITDVKQSVARVVRSSSDEEQAR